MRGVVMPVVAAMAAVAVWQAQAQQTPVGASLPPYSNSFLSKPDPRAALSFLCHPVLRMSVLSLCCLIRELVRGRDLLCEQLLNAWCWTRCRGWSLWKYVRWELQDPGTLPFRLLFRLTRAYSIHPPLPCVTCDVALPAPDHLTAPNVAGVLWQMCMRSTAKLEIP